MTGYFDASLDRGEALTEELAAEYDRCLTAQQVSSLAIELTHEVFEKYRGVLDRLARRYWPALPR